MHLLVVEPSSTRRRTLRRPLEAALDLPVEEAEGSVEALTRLKSLREVIVLTGPVLGEMPAPAFAGAVRRMAGHASTSLLLVTPPLSHDEFLAAVDAGYESCILIPFDEDLLVGKVRRALDAAAARAAQSAPSPLRRYRHRGLLRDS